MSRRPLKMNNLWWLGASDALVVLSDNSATVQPEESKILSKKIVCFKINKDQEHATFQLPAAISIGSSSPPQFTRNRTIASSLASEDVAAPTWDL
jgi:hypothetical protein